MKPMRVEILDVNGNPFFIPFSENEYPSLLEMITNTMTTEIGDCKGRAWCGTCALRLLEGTPDMSINPEESIKLNEISIHDRKGLRLACQVNLEPSIHQSRWQILESRNYL
jgi:2Fe-2S ferredoxin